jgi:hypothetical protein
MKRSFGVLLGLGAVCLVAPAQAEAQRDEAGWTWRTSASLGIVGTTYFTAWGVVSAVWWTSDASDFSFRDEGAFGLQTYAGGTDKLGHVYANYLMSRVYTDVLEWGGLSRQTALLTSTLLTTAFFTGVELKDAYQPRYGFSVGDVFSNLAGEAAAIGVTLVPELNSFVSFKLSYFPSPDFRRAVASGGRLNVPEDYSGQTYLLAFHLAALADGRLKHLRYVDLSLGFGTEGYEPLPAERSPVRQTVSLGVSLNLRSLCDDLLGGDSSSASTGAAVAHFANDVFQPPFTRLPAFTYERVGPPR